MERLSQIKTETEIFEANSDSLIQTMIEMQIGKEILYVR